MLRSAAAPNSTRIKAYDRSDNPPPAHPANIGLAEDGVPAPVRAIANYSARDITLVLGLVLCHD